MCLFEYKAQRMEPYTFITPSRSTESYGDFTTSDSKRTSDSSPSATSFCKDALYRLTPLAIDNHEPQVTSIGARTTSLCNECQCVNTIKNSIYSLEYGTLASPARINFNSPITTFSGSVIELGIQVPATKTFSAERSITHGSKLPSRK